MMMNYKNNNDCDNDDGDNDNDEDGNDICNLKKRAWYVCSFVCFTFPRGIMYASCGVFMCL